MKVEVETPGEYQGAIIGDLSSRRGIIQETHVADRGDTLVSALVPLSEMFGYATVLRSYSAGKATYTMEFIKYAECPAELQKKIVKERAEKLSRE